MPEIGVLKELLIVLTITISIVFIFQKLRLPAIVGFLLAGVILGPHGLSLIRQVEQVEMLAEIGVVLLLFTIGLEASLGQLLPVHRMILWAGTLQILLTALAVFLLFALSGHGPESALFYGFLVSLSSTAVVLKIYADRRETDALHGRLAMGVLVFQDLCLIPMMLLLPVLGRGDSVSPALIGLAVAKSAALVLAIVVGARKLLPWVLRQVAYLKNRELFVLLVVFICLGTAWLTWESGLSLAVGAFIAGLVISESEFSHQIVADFLPLRDCFSGIFFISVGMLLELGFLFTDFLTPIGNLFLIIGLKGVVTFIIFWWLYRSVRLGVVMGFSLAQIGEFSFILAQAGRPFGLLPAPGEQSFLAASILSMLATPFLIQWSHSLGYGLGRIPSLTDLSHKGEPADAIEGHVIVVGYGLNGENLSQVLKEVGIPYRILDLDADLARRARAAGEPISFGDGTRPEILDKLGIARARVLVVAISDPLATARVVSLARRLRHDLYIIVRTRYVAEIERLYGLGANQVIPEEFETSVEIFARVLQEYHIPRNVIGIQVDLIRKGHYGTLRGMHLQGKHLDALSQYLAGTTTDTVLILEASPAVGKSLEELQLRSRSGVTVIAAVHDGRSTTNPPLDFRLSAGDILVLLGSHKELDQAMEILNPPGHSGEG